MVDGYVEATAATPFAAMTGAARHSAACAAARPRACVPEVHLSASTARRKSRAGLDSRARVANLVVAHCDNRLLRLHAPPSPSPQRARARAASLALVSGGTLREPRVEAFSHRRVSGWRREARVQAGHSITLSASAEHGPRIRTDGG